jgi:hypothetical protein
MGLNAIVVCAISAVGIGVLIFLVAVLMQNMDSRK